MNGKFRLTTYRRCLYCYTKTEKNFNSTCTVLYVFRPPELIWGEVLKKYDTHQVDTVYPAQIQQLTSYDASQSSQHAQIVENSALEEEVRELCCSYPSWGVLFLGRGETCVFGFVSSEPMTHMQSNRQTFCCFLFLQYRSLVLYWLTALFCFRSFSRLPYPSSFISMLFSLSLSLFVSLWFGLWFSKCPRRWLLVFRLGSRSDIHKKAQLSAGITSHRVWFLLIWHCGFGAWTWMYWWTLTRVCHQTNHLPPTASSVHWRSSCG